MAATYLVYLGETRIIPSGIGGVAPEVTIASCAVTLAVEGGANLSTTSAAAVQNGNDISASFEIVANTLGAGSFELTFAYTLSDGEVINDYVFVIIGAYVQAAGPVVSPASLLVGTTTAYDLSYVLDTTAFCVGDSPELLWLLTPASAGNSVTGLEGGSLSLLRPDGLTDWAPTLIVSTEGTAASIRIGAVVAFEQSGVYTVVLQVTTTDTPVQTRSCTTLINVT